MSLNTTARTFVTSEVETAAIFNLELRDAINGLQAAWTTYTPTTTGLTLGNGTIAARWQRIGKTIDFTIVFTLGSTSAVTSPTFTLPVTALNTDWASADCNIFDTSASNRYPAAAVATSATLVAVRQWPAVAQGTLAVLSATSPFTWATGDFINLAGRYEAA